MIISSLQSLGSNSQVEDKHISTTLCPTDSKVKSAALFMTHSATMKNEDDPNMKMEETVWDFCRELSALQRKLVALSGNAAKRFYKIEALNYAYSFFRGEVKDNEISEEALDLIPAQLRIKINDVMSLDLTKYQDNDFVELLNNTEAAENLLTSYLAETVSKIETLEFRGFEKLDPVTSPNLKHAIDEFDHLTKFIFYVFIFCKDKRKVKTCLINVMDKAFKERNFALTKIIVMALDLGAECIATDLRSSRILENYRAIFLNEQMQQRAFGDENCFLPVPSLWKKLILYHNFELPLEQVSFYEKKLSKKLEKTVRYCQKYQKERSSNMLFEFANSVNRVVVMAPEDLITLYASVQNHLNNF